MKLENGILCLFAGLSLVGVGATAFADEAEINRRLDLLSREIESLKSGSSVEGGSTPESKDEVNDETKYGVSGSAQKVYKKNRGVSLGGYGEMLYENFKGHRDNGTPPGTNKVDRIDFLRHVIYTGYRFNDRFLLNTEVELEHAFSSQGNGPNGSSWPGEVALEFAYVDYLHSDVLNFRAGMVLVPMGFTNEMHEPTLFNSARRPEVEQIIIPSTWRENGFGLFGDVGPVTYRAYMISNLNSNGFSAGSMLKDGRQRGGRALVQNGWAWVGRADYTAMPGLLAGASYYAGNSPQYVGTSVGAASSIPTKIYEGHAQWKSMGFDVKALAAFVSLEKVQELNAARGLSGTNAIGAKAFGYYGEVGYDVMPYLCSDARESSLIPFVRWEKFNTQDEVPVASGLSSQANQGTLWVYGMAYKPIDQIVLKADYQDYQIKNNTGVNQVNASLGYTF